LSRYRWINDDKITVKINLADIVEALTMKGLTLPRLVDKDSYAMYIMSGFHGGNPTKASGGYLNRFKEVSSAKEGGNTTQHRPCVWVISKKGSFSIESLSKIAPQSMH